ncbi:hypothetical protein Gotri_013923 [Gossypium trilobum]|uniref:Uncharacterized protein n=3 Tax=Gossypium TaxID=3633 RepID=A0A7J9DV08_9ROSI|nr:hypothetical protein [Gossypium davidsonii]MBA0647426.1 hypothetical protein [Gossypium klotzschianum]MBA0764583.1 hypothetical protein [Gossypium trilobum]
MLLGVGCKCGLRVYVRHQFFKHTSAGRKDRNCAFSRFPKHFFCLPFECLVYYGFDLVSYVTALFGLLVNL